MSTSTVIRVEKTKNYTVMSNHHLKNKGLSLKSKGLLSTILSLPDNWNYSIAGLAALCRDGVDTVKSALTELEDAGYISRKRLRNSRGQLAGIEYTVHEIPVREEDNETTENVQMAVTEPEVENPPQAVTEEKPKVENPPQESPLEEKHTLLNTNNILSTNILNTNTPSSTISINNIYGRIRYDELVEENEGMEDVLEAIADVMLEAETSEKECMVNGVKRTPDDIKNKMQKVKKEHIEYVLELLKGNGPEIRNYRLYILTALYNAPAGMAIRRHSGTGTSRVSSAGSPAAGRKNRFHNFDERKTNYDDMMIDITAY